MDVISEILSSVHVDGGVYFCDRVAPPWSMDGKNDYSAGFHYVRSGQCWVGLSDKDDEGDEGESADEQYLLGPGDLVFFGHGDDHVLSSYKHQPDEPSFEGETFLLCGYFNFRDALPLPLANSIPPMLILRAEQISQFAWLEKTLEHLSSEYDAQSPGANVVVNKLTEVVLVELIRFHLNQSDKNNFVAALFDQQIGKALELIHAQPEKVWTLETLASEVAMSRASFARKFKDLVGQPMFQYLSTVRMRMASTQLRFGNKPVIDIAESVGYQSELAFSKVFKEHFSITPTAYRKQALSDLKSKG